MDTAVATGAFTLAGVALGAALEWARSAIAARRSAAAERDELFATLGSAGTRLLMHALLIRDLNRPGSKFRQLLAGVMEGEAQRRS